MRTILIILVAVCLPAGAGAQIRVMRNMLFPAADTAASVGWLGKFGGAVDMQRGFGSPEKYLAWMYKIAAYAELYRGDGWSVGFVHANELTANPNSPISFNPRAVLWEENIIATWRLPDMTVRAGVVHRCKHDVDDSEPDDFSNVPPGFVPERRIIIVTGAEAAITLHDLDVSFATATVSAAAAGYLNAADYRERGLNLLPDNAYSQPDFRTAAGALTFVTDFRRHLGGAASVYVRGFGEAVLMLQPQWNGRIEAGVSVRGAAGSLSTFLAAERQSDDFSGALPRSATVLCFGARFAGGGLE